MIQAFKERRWWAVALVVLLLDPVVGMLYLNRGMLAALYLVIQIVVVAAMLAISHFDTTTPARDAMGTALWIIAFVGTAHGIFIAIHRPRDERLRWYSHWYSVVAIFLIPLGLVLTVRSFFYQPFNMPSSSMEPTIDVGDNFLVSKRAFDGEGPRRGDLVVFYFRATTYVKRIVGLPGDRIQIVDGRLRINGAFVPKSRIEDFIVGKEKRGARQYVETIKPGRSFRTLDLIDDSGEDNTGVFIVPPESYFVLGDNRDNSNDSRLGLGYILRSNIIGKPIVKFIDGRRQALVLESIE